MWRGILAAVLIVFAIIGVRQFSNAQQDTSGKDQQDTSSNEEVEICRGKNRFTYEANGKRYSLPFETIDGQAVVEGDIVIGSAADFLSGGANYVAPVVPDYVRGQPKRWGNGVAPYVVPFVIDDSVSASDRVLIEQAMSLWVGATNISFRELSGTRDWRRENYVKFSGREKRCSSNSLGIKEKFTAGAVSAEQNINVVQVAGCGSWGSIAHEIGHVLGLGHEQSRGDRDDYITILWSNIQKGKGVQYCRAIWDQQTLVNTAYDFDSIMHYPVDGFAEKSGCPKEVIYEGKPRCLALVPNQEKVRQQQQLLRSAIKIGQTDHLSEGDIGLVNMLYPASPSPPAPTTTQPCAITTTTTIKVGDRTTTTTKTEPCPTGDQQTLPPPPDRDRCCHVQRPRRPLCRPDVCRPTVRVSWPQPDRWCRSGWCRPRPRRLCDGRTEDGWERPPFDDWDDERW
jgi:hypothetical protein